MRRTHIILFLFICAAVTIVAGSILRNKTSHAPQISEIQEKPTPQNRQFKLQEEKTVRTSEPTAAPTSTPTESAQREAGEDLQSSPALPTQMPLVTDVRKELEQNPHGTPESVHTFGLKIYKRMQLAYKSPQAGAAVFNELKECVRAKPETAITSIQSLCLLNAKRLAARFPTLLSSDYVSLQQTAASEVVQVMNLVE